MTLNSNLFYKYVESSYVAQNYLDELKTNIVSFFEARDIQAFLLKSSDPCTYLLIQILTEVDTDVLEEAARGFAKEFDVEFLTLVKELSVHYENNRRIGSQVNEYRLVFKKKRMVA